MTGATDLVLRCKTLKPLSDEQRWRDLLSALRDETEDKTHATLLLAEVLGALYPTFTVTLRGISQEAAVRVEKAVRRALDRKKATR